LKRRVWVQGWWRHARRCVSPHHNARPLLEGAALQRPVLAVIHSISLPAGQYGQGHVQRLFCGHLNPQAHPSFESLRGLRVSAHFLVSRGGGVTQFVSCERRAWHAGLSSWKGRDDCNDYSVGIELEGLEGLTFTPAQYRALSRLLRAMRRQYGVREVVGHEHVAPGRKRDPGEGFDWRGLRLALGPSWCFPS
jgi:AmpD protein